MLATLLAEASSRNCAACRPELPIEEMVAMVCPAQTRQRTGIVCLRRAADNPSAMGLQSALCKRLRRPRRLRRLAQHAHKLAAVVELRGQNGLHEPLALEAFGVVVGQKTQVAA